MGEHLAEPASSGRTLGPEPATLGYEAAREELVAVVAKLESGSATLEESLTLWERGEALAQRCQQWLDTARERLAAAQRSPEQKSPEHTSSEQKSSEQKSSEQKSSEQEGSARD